MNMIAKDDEDHPVNSQASTAVLQYKCATQPKPNSATSA